MASLLSNEERIAESSFRPGKVPARLSLNRIAFSINFSKSELLRFSSTVQTSKKKT
jgi:hypothetical protein